MSYYLVDFDKFTKMDNNTFNFENLLIGKKINFDNMSKYYIYYQNDNNESPKEIYIKLPKLRLIYSLSKNKFDGIDIPIYPTWDKTKIFIKFIKKLESDIVECFESSNTNLENIEFSSLIKKKENQYYIKTKINNIVKISSDILDNPNITLNDFLKNGQIKMVIKISFVWMNKTNYGLSSEIYQIKYYAPPSQLNIDFIDEQQAKRVEPTDNIYESQKQQKQQTPQLTQPLPPPPPPPPPPPNYFATKNNLDTKAENIIKKSIYQTNPTNEIVLNQFIPSKELLEKALNRLKKKKLLV